MPALDWQFLTPLGDDAQVGESYVCRAETLDGRFWAKLMITITDRRYIEELGDIGYDFTIDTILDGSPGLVDGWDTGAQT